jgi:carbohydrate kinase (thermoresistant glucokinase family)
MGVAGAGKTTVGEALAATLRIGFADGDQFHSPAAIEKMTNGVALNDADRAPWLDAIGDWLADRGGVVACSALRRAYRDRLRSHAPSTFFVHLSGDPDIVRQRVGARVGHYMPASLVESQLATLEGLQADEAGITIDVTRPVEEVVADVIASYAVFRGRSGAHLG